MSGFDKTWGVEINCEGTLQLGECGCILELKADDPIGVNRLGVSNQIRRGREATRTVLLSMEIVHLVAGRCEGTSVIPGAQGTACDGLVATWQLAMMNNEDAHTRSILDPQNSQGWMTSEVHPSFSRL